MSQYTALQIAHLFGVQEKTVHQWRVAGVICPTNRTKQGYLFDREKVHALLPEHLRDRPIRLLSPVQVQAATGANGNILRLWAGYGILTCVRVPSARSNHERRYVEREVMAALRIPANRQSLTIADTAKLLGVSWTVVRQLVADGTLTPTRVLEDRPLSQQPVDCRSIRRYLVRQLYA